MQQVQTVKMLLAPCPSGKFVNCYLKIASSTCTKLLLLQRTDRAPMFELHFFMEWKLIVTVFIDIEEKYKQKAMRGYLQGGEKKKIYSR